MKMISLLLALPALASALSMTAPTTKMPVLYVYDHCPFCVRVRVALGLKGVKYDLRFMANDDKELPTSLVGKKIAPIWECAARDPFAESLDIVRYIDSEATYGEPGMFREKTDRADLAKWQKSVQTPLRLLQRPRYMKTYLPEFSFKSSRDAFVNNHQLPPYEKADWKSDALNMEQRWALYESSLDDSAALIAEVNEKLKDLEPLIHCDKCATEGGVSLDDIDLWSRLRSLTLVKGIEFPPTVRAYLDYFAEAGDTPLYDSMAL